VPGLARWLPGLGIAATLAANVATAWGTARPVPSSPWPAVALVGSYEPLIVIICGAQVSADVPDVAGVPIAYLMLTDCKCRPRIRR
jgi:hypothetical protein